MKLQRNLLIGIDEILDTRLTVLGEFSEKLAEDVLLSGAYHSRLKDEWPGLSRSAFRERYEKRDVDIVKNSVVTSMVKFVQEYLVGYNYELINEPMRSVPSVTFNFYPYTLNEEDVIEFLNVLHEAIGHNIPMEMQAINLSPAQLTPQYCSKTFTTMIMYDGLLWLEHHAKVFDKFTLADVELIVPALYHGDIQPDDPMILRSIAEGLHPIRATEQMAKNIIALKHIDVEFFSIVGYKGKPT